MVSLTVKTTEMHTGGEPVRIVESGLPEIQGETILDKRRFIRDNLDHVRKFVMHEPRGRHDMYGAYLVPTDIPDASLACILIHNEGYSPMCGHAIIALGRYAIDKGFVKNPTSPETKLVIQVPCGPVEVFAEYKEGKTGNVRFNSVPAFLFARDLETEVPGYGKVKFDISYGGNFYAILPAESLGLDMKTANIEEFKTAAWSLMDVLKKTELKLSHPDHDDLAYLNGIILTDGNDVYSPEETGSVIIFGDRQIDRSPCGSGVTARIAMQFARGLIQLNQQRTFRGLAGAKFKAQAVKQVKCGPHDAVIVEVSGKGHYSGSCQFTLEEGDEIGKGFLLK